MLKLHCPFRFRHTSFGSLNFQPIFEFYSESSPPANFPHFDINGEPHLYNTFYPLLFGVVAVPKK
jgi:hypothetical protein